MPFNGSGTFVRTQNWTNDASNNLPISATKFDNEDNDFASGLSLCLTRDGQGGPSVPLTWTQPFTLAIAADGNAFSVNRTAGVNNPGFQVQLNDGSSSVTLNQSLASGLLNLAVAGTAVLSLVAGQVQAVAGTAAKPAYGFAGDTNTGFYHVAADDLGMTVNGVQVMDWQAATITAFNSAITNGSTLAVVNTSTVSADTSRVSISAGSTNVALFAANQNQAAAIVTNGPTGAQAVLRTLGNYPLLLATQNTLALTIDGSGRFTFAAPSAGGQTNFTFNGRNGNNVASFVQAAGSGTAFGVVIQAGTTSADYALLVQTQAGGTNDLLRVSGTGEIFMQPPTVVNAGPNGTFQVGYLDMVDNLQNAAYQLVLSDRGKMIRHTSGSAHTWTIPANASVAFPVGTTIAFANVGSGGALTINITTDTLTWAPSNATGSRTLTGPGIATITKVNTGNWIIQGTNLS